MKPLFREVNYQLSKILAEIEDGEIGLPEIQRPFVWSRTKVRDLFDSMYRGFPVGYLLFWENPSIPSPRQIGTNAKQNVARRLIVDGQQRLTSLYSVIHGRPVVDDEYRETHLAIAFRPRDARFAVPDAAIERDPEFITNITDLWSGDLSRHRFQTQFIQRLRASRDVAHGEEDHIIEAIDQLYDLKDYPFTAIELSANAEEDQVADIFVRINSEGVELKQADFILTLMSVHWDKGRRELEEFCRVARHPVSGTASPFNHFIKPSPDELLRVTIGLGMRRALLKAVYPVLRGKDIETGRPSVEARDRQFALLRAAQEEVLDLTNWHEFLKSLRQAGYRSGAMITSEFNILFSYMIFLIGRRDHSIDYGRLRAVIARWFFMCAITGRYTGSSETRMEQDLRRLGGAHDADAFVAVLDGIVATQLTNDYWHVALPDLLETSGGYSPYVFAYHAALNLLGAKVLFSTLTVSELLDPTLDRRKLAPDRYQLFPRDYLKSQGFTSVTRINQLANYALLEWPDNIKVGKQAPADYFPKLWEERVAVSERERTRFLHALPDDWETLEYDAFLVQRCVKIAHVIRAAFEQLKSGKFELPTDTAVSTKVWPSVADLIASEESGEIEFKGSAAVSLHNDAVPERVINDQVIKTVAAFLNTDGGALGIGISDSREVLGVEADLAFKKMDLDRYLNWLTSILITSCGAGPVTANTRIRGEVIDDRTVVVVHVTPAPKPVFVKTSKVDEAFYVRANNTTRSPSISEVPVYVAAHWG
ncbi:MAG: DUF262 domain-containing protein [Actinomycetia bacterium]|nr:DUF262 domain-containing protein [Actinomycetes bacterium]